MDLKDKLIKLGSEQPELREHIRPILDEMKAAARSKRAYMELVDYIIPRDEFFDLMDHVDASVQEGMFAIHDAFRKKLDLSNREEQALNRIRNLAKGRSRNPGDIRNQVAKAMLDLGIKPKFMF